MERHFDQDLQQLKERILHMGSLAETMIHVAIKALADRKLELTQDVFRQEDEVNKLQIEIDERCLSSEDNSRRAHLTNLLTEHEGNISAVARHLGKARMQVQRWLKRHGLEAATFRG